MQNLHFDVSSGLKSVLGSELITDDEVAIFELVKNSFDAEAKRVDLHFSEDSIVISDNGNGMSYDDIKSKWLFVAYSSKRDGQAPVDFRDEIAERRHYAGSKGIGRFSSDRLGQMINLQTRPRTNKAGPVHSVTVDWNLFDANHKKHFDKIDVEYDTQSKGFKLPSGLPALTWGTVITISQTKREWDRETILRLKAALAKLINPFGAAVDKFQIKIHAPAELDADKLEMARAKARQEKPAQNAIVNGDVGNFIFETLQEKTTFIEVQIDSSGHFIESVLVDRSELIYKIREPNEYPLLANSGFRCQIYFLNQSAKMTFARRMGVPSVQFGSVFLFRNGFRIFPVGEEDDDWFGMDRRKQQGFRRFLGTRDVIGRIDVTGANQDFQEASSRNTGLIATPAVDQLRQCFRDHCLKRLERYVIPVTWVDKEDKNSSDVSRLLTDHGKARVAAAVAKLVDSDDIELIEYSKRLIGVLSERSEQFEASLSSLRAIADKTKDKGLFEKIEKAEKRFEELRRSEEIARRQADEERRAKEEAQARAERAETRASQTEEELEEEKKRNLFLTSISSLDTDTILNLHHQVTIYAVDVQQQIENFLVECSQHKSISVTAVVDALEAIALLNRKIMGISKFATKANFRLKSEKIEADLSEYISQYINQIAKDFIFGRLKVRVTTDQKGITQKFNPIDISVVIDNLIANAKKAQATQMSFSIYSPSRTSTYIDVVDNGNGFHSRIKSLDQIFQKGFTLTDGSGLGLYHVRHVLGEMNGTIEAHHGPNNKGAKFQIKISK